MASMRAAAVDTVAEVEVALSDLVRLFNRPWLQRRLMERANVRLDVGAYWALKRLGAAEGLRPSDLAAALLVDASTVTHRVQALERAGLVERLPDPADGRASVLRLTPEGESALDRLREARHDLFERLLDGWSDDERTGLARAVDRLSEALRGEIPDRE